MTNGFTHVRVGHAGFHRQHPKRSPPPSCNTGGFYQHPTNGVTIDCSQPLDIGWDKTCLDSSAIDIYLYAPGANKSRLHMWQTVDNSKGSYNATIDPKWWNSTSTITLQLAIVASGTPPFLSPFPAGPVFNAKYTGPASPASADSSSSNSGITQVNNMGGALQKSLAPGRAAAAVIIPLLIIAALITMYIRHSRSKGKEQHRRFSQAVDKRMSTISTDWKSMSGAGANAAIRNSIAVSGSRASSFSFGAIRPSSTFAPDGGQAGVGAQGLYSHENSSIDPPVMSQLRQGVRTTPYGERVSRVSFAADPRPSAESRRNVPSRAFHNAYTPPIPNLRRQNSDDDAPSPGTLSPTQTQGPLTLTPEDIRARIAGQKHNENSSVDEVMPALSMMRTGGEGATSGEDYLLPASPIQHTALPQPPMPSHSKSHVGMMPMQPMPANVMSPDEMLRAYAERRPTTGGSAVSYPAPVVNYNGSGMRTLYSPATTITTTMTTTTTLAPTIPAQTHGKDFGNNQQYRVSHAGSIGSRYSDTEAYDAYVGTAK